MTKLRSTTASCCWYGVERYFFQSPALQNAVLVGNKSEA